MLTKILFNPLRLLKNSLIGDKKNKILKAANELIAVFAHALLIKTSKTFFPTVKMEVKEMYLLLIAIIALLAGFSYSYFVPTPVELGGVPFFAMAAGFFLAGTIFFGYFSFLPLLFFGLQMGAQRNAAIFLYLIPSILAAYAGIKLGLLLADDFKRKKIFLEQGKTILALVIIALVLAIAIEQSIPYIMQFWPNDFLGMNVESGNTVVGLIGQLTGMIQN